MSNVRLTEIYGSGHGSSKVYSLRSIYINTSHVICLREDEPLKMLLSEGRLVDGMDKRQDFTRITINKSNLHEDIVVVGAIEEIQKKISSSNKEILRG